MRQTTAKCVQVHTEGNGTSTILPATRPGDLDRVTRKRLGHAHLTLLEEEVPTSSASWSGTLTSLLNTLLKIPPPAALVEGVSLRWFILSCEYLISLNQIHAHTCYQSHRGNGSQNLQRLSDFLQRLSNFPQRLSKILNSFLLSEKSEKIYLRQEAYERSLFELCIFCHSLSHLRSELCNTRYNTQHTPVVHLCSQQCTISKI